jgi:hypothetical protein
MFDGFEVDPARGWRTAPMMCATTYADHDACSFTSQTCNYSSFGGFEDDVVRAHGVRAASSPADRRPGSCAQHIAVGPMSCAVTGPVSRFRPLALTTRSSKAGSAGYERARGVLYPALRGINHGRAGQT